MNRSKTIFQPIVFGLLGLLVLTSCRKDLSSDTPNSYNTVESLISDGWEYYLGGDYELALDAFQLTSERNAQAIEGYIGKGWTYLRLGYAQHSMVEFNVVLNLANESNDNASMADAYAGLFLIALDNRFSAQTDPEQNPTEDDLAALNNQIIEMGEKVFVYDEDYSTSHDPDFTFEEIHVALAQTYFNVSRFQDALEHILPVFNIWVITEPTSIEISPWVNTEEVIQGFNLNELDEPVSLNIPSGYTIIVDDIKDINNDNASVKGELFDYLLNHNIVELNSEYSFVSNEERIFAQTVSHAQPGSASRDFVVLNLGKKGVFQIESVQKISVEEVTTWYYVDANNDTTLADGVYEDDGTGYFFSVLSEEEVFTDIESSLWTPVDPDTDAPADTVNGIPYHYNMVNLPSESSDGDEYLISYKYGSYLIDCVQTTDYINYLETLNSFLSGEWFLD